MKRRVRTNRGWIFATLAAVVMLPLSGCNEWLEKNYQDNNITRLHDDVDFVATSASFRHLTGAYAEFKERENFFIELLGDPTGATRDAMILDLVAPKGATTPEGTYTVGFVGDYVALSRYDVVDENSGMVFFGGSYYGQAVNGIIKDYYGFLTTGTVVVTRVGEEGNNYTVRVAAYSGDYSVSVTFDGEFQFIEPEEKE